MKQIWSRITLMQYATDEDDGRIPPDAMLGTVVTFLFICGAYLVACALVKG